MMTPEKIAKKFRKDLEANRLDGIAFVADPKAQKGSFALNVNNGVDMILMLTQCIANVAAASHVSPWNVIEAIGYFLGKCQAPEDITPQLKEFADVSRALYEYENRDN